MKLEIKKIFCHGKNRSKIHMSLYVEYGFQGEMYSDTLSLTYDGNRNNTYLTAKIQKPGIGIVVNRIIDVLTINKATQKNNPRDIFNKLGHYLELKYDEKMLREALSRFKTP